MSGLIKCCQVYIYTYSVRVISSDRVVFMLCQALETTDRRGESITAKIVVNYKKKEGKYKISVI